MMFVFFVDYNFEFEYKDVLKGNVLIYVIKEFGGFFYDIIVIGDSFNDVLML